MLHRFAFLSPFSNLDDKSELLLRSSNDTRVCPRDSRPQDRLYHDLASSPLSRHRTGYGTVFFLSLPASTAYTFEHFSLASSGLAQSFCIMLARSRRFDPGAGLFESMPSIAAGHTGVLGCPTSDAEVEPSFFSFDFVLFPFVLAIHPSAFALYLLLFNRLVVLSGPNMNRGFGGGGQRYL